MPVEAEGAEPVYHLYVIQTDRRDELAGHLSKHGIETGVHYPMPNHRQPATLARIQPPPSPLPETERIVGRILSLPMYADCPTPTPASSWKR